MQHRVYVFKVRRITRLLAWLLFFGSWSSGFSQATTSTPLTPSASLDSEPVRVMDAVSVKGEKVSAIDREGPQQLDRYDPDQIFDSGAFSVNEFLEQLPPSNSGSEVLVLIDGQPAYIDPSSLPLGMIEGIDVSREGSMPEHGAYAEGQVINIRLKKNYRDAELGARIRGTFAGGGAQENVRLSGGASKGKVRAMFSFDYTQTHSLSAMQRSFSREQDHTARGGRDLRLDWGYPAVVESVSGPLNGLTDANGNPTSVALIPENQNGLNLMPADFLTAGSSGSANADGQRRFNTAPYRTLVAPGSRADGSVTINYALSPRLQFALTGSVSDSRSERIGAPPVTSASSKSRVPAAFNPFGQDVEVGLVHLEFGPTRQASQSTTRQFGLKVNGRFAATWSWNGGIAQVRRRNRQATTDLDQDKFSAALSASDPAFRFNPFGDARQTAVNASLYPALTVIRLRNETQRDSRLDLGASGQLMQLRGGAMSLSLRGNYSDRQQERVNFRSASGGDSTTQRKRESATLSASLTAPLIGQQNAKPLLRRLEANFSTRYSMRDDDGAGRDESAGLVWVPAKSLLLRARHSVSSTTSRQTILPDSEILVGETLIDPARADAAVSNVEVFNRDMVIVDPSKTERSSIGATFEPGFLSGFRFSATYDVRRRGNILHRDFEPQDIINNERAFPGRVIRSAPSAEDFALGRPGAISAIDITPGNLGAAETHDVSYSVDYRLSSKELGRFRFTASAQQFLKSTHEIAPGVPYVYEGSGDDNPPDWSFQGQAAWSRKAWNTSVRFRYTGALAASASNSFGVEAAKNVDLNIGYRFQSPLWKKFGRGTRVLLRIENVFDEDPPFADTIVGYRGGSPLGRAFSVAVTVPLR
jgi:iron complex outermembrane receptor protein